MELLRHELPDAGESEICLDEIVRAVGQLQATELIAELAELAGKLNRRQLAGDPPAHYSESHARRSTVLKAFASELDRLSETQLGSEALQVVGPPEFGMIAIKEDALAQWRESATP
jgi:hypothetical protein